MQQDLNVQYDWQNAAPRELPEFDVKPYVGRRVTVAAIKEGVHEKHGPFIDVETDSLEKLANEKDLVVRKRFWLRADDNGAIFWPSLGKLAGFLKKMGCAHYRELVGKEVVISYRTADDGKDWLTFG